MARSDQTGDWAGKLSPSLDEIESIAVEAYAHLPEDFRTLTGEIGQCTSAAMLGMA